MKVKMCWFMIVVCVMCLFRADADDSLDLTMIIGKAKNDSLNVTCIANGNALDSALTWISPIKDTFPETQTYFAEVIENFDTPSTHWITDSWHVGISNHYSFGAVLDQRWEKFNLLTVDGELQTQEIDVEAESLTLSIRMENDSTTEIFLRDEFNSLTYGMKITKNSIILKFNNAEKQRINVDLNQAIWLHVTVSWKNKGRVMTTIGDNSYEFSVRRKFRPKFWKLKSNKQVQLKVHDYNFWWTNEIIDLQPIGPILTRNVYTVLSVFIRLCERCQMILALESSVTNKETITANGTDYYNQWHEVSIPFANSSVDKYKLLVGTFCMDSGSCDRFWAIDDVTKLKPDEVLRRSSKVVPKSEILNWGCQSMRYPEIPLMPKFEVSNVNLCTIPNNTGRNCNIGCETIFSEKISSCQATKTCVLENSRNSKCYCSSGYKGRFCANECTNGFWGGNCKMKCGKCADNVFCHKITGECENGCADGYTGKKCQRDWPMLNYAPEVVKNGITSVSIKFINNTYVGQDPKRVKIEYREKEGSEWTSATEFDYSYFPKLIIIKDLNIATTYDIRAILCNKNLNCYSESDVPTTEAATSCNDLLDDFVIETTNTTATIKLNRPKTTENDCQLEFYRAIVLSIQIKNISEIIPNLQPYRTYKITLFNTFLETSKTLNFRTKAGIINVSASVERTDVNNIVIRWNVLNSVLEAVDNFNVYYQHVRYRACSEEKNFNTKIFYSSVSNKTSFTIKNLEAYSIYSINVSATTISGEGLKFNLIGDTKEMNEIGDEELPINQKFKNQSIVLTLPSCDKVKGQLKYNLTYRCFKQWCNQSVSNLCSVDVTKKTAECNIPNNLIGCTEYTVEIRGQRPIFQKQTPSQREFLFKTLPGKPAAISDLTVYSKDENSISLRWKPPFPPNGELESYKIFASIYASPQEIKPTKCDLWDDYHCAELDDLERNTDYFIYIRAKNKYVEVLGNKSNDIVVKTKQEKSQAPKIVSMNFTSHDHLIVKWAHPSIINGPLKNFEIKFDVLESEYQSKPRSLLIIPVREEMKIYRYVIDELEPSTWYNISIRGINLYEGESSSINISTKPPKPEFVSPPYLSLCVEQECQIHIPEGKNFSKQSAFYIIAIDVTAIENEECNATEYIKNSCDGKGGNIDPFLIVKNGSVKTDFFGQPLNVSFVNLNNKAKEEGWNSIKFEIIIVLKNTYRDQHQFTEYVLKQGSIEKATTKLTLLWLLLLVIPIGLVVWLIIYRGQRNTFGNARVSIRKRNNSEQIITSVSNDKQNKNCSEDSIPMLLEDIRFINDHQVEFSRPVKVNNFEEYVKDSIEGGNENNELYKQHKSLPRGMVKACGCGTKPTNKNKNRYNNLAAYDYNRVVLEKIDGDEDSDYINASYIDSFDTRRAYIATQDPKITTVEDFWRMIWQENVNTIIMIANQVENNKNKCAEYCPTINNNKIFEEIIVINEKFEISSDYELTTLKIIKNRAERVVNHFHFTAWSAHDVPHCPQSLVPFIKKINTIPYRKVPIVLHCSAGVGRIGTIMLCDMALRMAAKKDFVDMWKLCALLRDQRVNMVYSEEQYKLAHLVVLECMFGMNTNILCENNFSEVIKKHISSNRIEFEMDYLERIFWQDQAMKSDYISKTHPENTENNRYQNVVSALESDGYMSLKYYPIDETHFSYINAVYVDGFLDPKRFIATQQPLPNTIGDFWRLVAENEVKIIISLNQINIGDKTSCFFWPLEDEEKMQPTPFISIKCLNTEKVRDIYAIINLLLTDSSGEEENNFNVTIIYMKKWLPKSQTPELLLELLIIWEEMSKLMRASRPAVVTCYDGVTASGLFLALTFLIEKINLYHECDVCLAVRTVRLSREPFVRTRIQFEFLYEAVLVYLSSFDTYSNFKQL